MTYAHVVAEALSTEHRKLGLAIARRRQTLALSQQQVADAAGLNRAYLAGVERGERNLALRNLLLIAKALQTPVAGLLDGIDVEQARSA